MSYTRCVHFNGVQNPCEAGVDPMTVRDTAGPGMARFPCLDIGKPCGTTCALRRLMTADEVAEEEATIDAAVAKMMADIAANRCPRCQAQIAKREQVGRCQYARPCGHRLGQVDGEEEGP